MMKTVFLLLGLLAQCSASDLGDQLQTSLVYNDVESVASNKAEEESGKPIQFQIEGASYFYHEEHRTFGSAEAECKRTGGYLASIHNEDTNKYVNGVALHQNSNAAHSWIGGFKRAYSTTFRWTDGSQWDFARWHHIPARTTYSHDLCVHMNHRDTGRWFLAHCNEAKPYVCKL